ncbi:pyrimidine reductase family protein [Gordonia desulfuricans]|nr:pyrimidine reductase family protein [Gordonia desulfuricans]
MLYQHKAIHVTPDDADETDLYRVLADRYPHPERYVRANMIATIDGAISVSGRSGQLGGPTDRAVFRTLRGLADVVLVGAATALAETYHQPQPDPQFSAHRGAGRPAAPVLALVSRSLTIDPAYPPLAHPDTLVLTCAAADPQRRHALTASGATLVDCGEGTVDLVVALRHLGERGLTRVLCEGGPRLLGSMIAADLLDELCISTSPMLAAGDAPRIALGPDLPHLPRFTPTQILSDDDGYVFTRWTRAAR